MKMVLVYNIAKEIKGNSTKIKASVKIKSQDKTLGIIFGMDSKHLNFLL